MRLMLAGCETAVRLGGSALKNALAISLALAKNNKQISGKVNLGRMLKLKLVADETKANEPYAINSIDRLEKAAYEVSNLATEL